MNNKKGFTLIETLVTTTIALGMVTVMICAIVTYIGVYEKESNDCLQKFYTDEAFLFIDEKLRSADYAELVEKNNNKEIKIVNSKRTDYIKKKGDNVVIEYYSNRILSVNNIILNIKDFQLFKVKNLLYAKIITCSGKEYERCFYLRPKKDI